MRSAKPLHPIRVVGIAGLCALVSACGQRAELEPAKAANTVAEDTAVARAGNVYVKTEVDTWPGDPAVRNHVTPVRVVLENQGDQPVRVRYQQFKLVSADGQEYRALPPYRIEGEITSPMLYNNYDPFMPGFEYSAFDVDPLYADVYPDLDPAYMGAYDYELDYYGNYYGYWDRELPTLTMLKLVIPEGVLRPGGRVSGYMYFQRIDPDDTRRVQLVAEMINANNGRMVGRASIPFTVKEG